jgi:hypothetical protein
VVSAVSAKFPRSESASSKKVTNRKKRKGEPDVPVAPGVPWVAGDGGGGLA